MFEIRALQLQCSIHSIRTEISPISLICPSIAKCLVTKNLHREGRQFPVCDLDIDQKFGGMGVSDESEDHPVPNSLYDIQCPHCGNDLMDAAYDAWNTESDLALMDRVIECSQCNSSTVTKSLKYGESMSFARFYVFVSDCDQEEWDPRFRKMLEMILGPCNEYWEWST